MRVFIFFLFFAFHGHSQVVIHVHSADQKLVRSDSIPATFTWLHKNRRDLSFKRKEGDFTTYQVEHKILKVWENKGAQFKEVLSEGNHVIIGFYKNIRMVTYTYPDGSFLLISGSIIY